MATRISTFGKGRGPMSRLPLTLMAVKGGFYTRFLHCWWPHIGAGENTRWSVTIVCQQNRQFSIYASRKNSFIGKDNNITGKQTETSRKDSEVTWLFPAGSIIEQLNSFQSRFNIGVLLTINSVSPLTVSHVTQALTLLQRKHQPLRTCLRRREGQLWMCESTNTDLDFKVLSTAEAIEEAHKLSCAPYNSEYGPLWRSRFQPCAEDIECPVPGLKTAFPHQYNVILGFHHGICDGISNSVIIRNFLKILEDMSSGVPEDFEEYGKLVSNEYIEIMEKEIRKEMEKDPEEPRKMTKEVLNSDFNPLLTEAFENPDVSEPSWSQINSLIDNSTMQVFSDKCKAAGITINSGLTSVINTVLVELLKEAGLKRNSYNITIRMAVDMRRYRDDDPEMVLGCHTMVFTHTVCTPHDIYEHFWEYAKEFDADIRWKLKSKYVIREKVIRDKITPKDLAFDQFSSSPPMIYDYFITNVYSPKFLNFGIGEYVQLTDMITFTNYQNWFFAYAHFIRVIRNQVQYKFLYSTRKISDDTAKMFLNRILETLKILTEM